MKGLVVINPATEEALIELPIAGQSEIDLKIRSAKNAQKNWRMLSYEQRASYIKKFDTLIRKNKESIAKTISLEMGKPFNEAIAEIDRAIENTNWFIKNVKDELKPKKLQNKVMLFKEPVGIVAAITPWNFPFMIPLWIIPPALLTGNTVIFKPSEISPMAGIKIMDLFNKVGLPKGCLNLLIGADEVGKRLVKSNVDIVAFVGSQKVGKDIMKNSANKLHKLCLELGGKNPSIICKDANLKKAVKDIVKGTLSNCGQLCASLERIYIEKEVYDIFIKILVKEVKSYGKLCPLSNLTQLKMVKSHLNDALKKGAKILLDGKEVKGKGYYFEPTVIINVNHSMKIMNQETFGPIIPVMKVNNIKQAIKFSNSLNYGLCASIYSKNKNKAKKIAEQLQAGTICVNCTPKSHAAFPWGGVKQSGFGRMLSNQGINEFLETKVVYLN